MPARHLSCSGCRIRVLANAPAIGLLEASCPICGLALIPAEAASGVIGLRLFDLDPFADGEPRRLGDAHALPTDLLGRRTAGSVANDLHVPRSPTA